MKASYPQAWRSAESVGAYVWEQHRKELELDEMMFLAIHISRL
ncbi:hypothetical protein [Chromobacterium rhizoryzae]